MSTTLFEAHENSAVLARIDALDGTSQPIWGKMNATEMCDHCARPMEVAVGERELDGPWFLKLFGRLMKNGVVGPKPFKKNLPTAKSFIPTDPADFETERARLRGLVERFGQGPSCLSGDPHPFFGPLSPDEWSGLMWKHLDHHLRQFGV